jgi:hypothetical protein
MRLPLKHSSTGLWIHKNTIFYGEKDVIKEIFKNAYSRCCWPVRCPRWFNRDTVGRLVIYSLSSSSKRRVASCTACYNYRHGEHLGHCSVYLTRNHHHSERSEYSSCSWFSSTSQDNADTFTDLDAFNLTIGNTFTDLDAFTLAFGNTFTLSLAFGNTFTLSDAFAKLKVAGAVEACLQLLNDGFLILCQQNLPYHSSFEM